MCGQRSDGSPVQGAASKASSWDLLARLSASLSPEAIHEGQEVPSATSLRTLLDCVPQELPRAYFESRDFARETLGIDAAETLRFEPGSTTQILASVPLTGCWLGGLRFDPSAPAAARRPEDSAPAMHWESFGAAWWLCPRLRFERSAGVLRLFVAQRQAESEAQALQAGAEALRRCRAQASDEEAQPEAELGAWQASPSTDRWGTAFDAALEALERGDLQKVVLAQALQASWRGSLALGAALELAAKRSPQSFRFALSAGGAESFLGASPELLLRAQGRQIETEALAGTRAAALCDELLQSDKEQREHDYVAAAIRSTLCEHGVRELCQDGPAPRVHGKLAHLRTSFRASLRDQAQYATAQRMLLARLHPTPAVAGEAREPALAFLRQHEGFDRGLYAGIVGRIDPQGLEIAVALRTALITQEHAFVPAGGGIVLGAEAHAEQHEIEQKSALWCQILASMSRRRQDA